MSAYTKFMSTAVLCLSYFRIRNEVVAKVNNYLLGDVNADESINVLDVVQLVNIILSGIEPSGYQIIVSDINLDGSINVLDVVQLVNIILG